MDRFVASFSVAALLVAAIPLSAGGASDLEASPGSAEIGPVYVDSAEIVYLESFPVQVQLRVTGSLPTPCHEPAFEVQDFGESIDVRLWSIIEPGTFCADVLEPFELGIPLGTFESASLPVILEGEEVGRIEVGGGGGGAPSLVGAGWSFGFCQGYCVAELVIEGDDLILTGRPREGEEALFVNRGRLTAEGRGRIDEADGAIAGVPLEPVYGCPDCADGGAFYVELLRDDVVERHVMEFGSPPEELAGLYALAAPIIAALETCGSSELVDVAEDCTPTEGAWSAHPSPSPGAESVDAADTPEGELGASPSPTAS